ncbi:hypothetical protein BMF35_a0576 [Aurantiacibacter gangjinensis]|nr:hypothetical protein BMF35_a0576 [Aurantiacibacter gangjinensis]
MLPTAFRKDDGGTDTIAPPLARLRRLHFAPTANEVRRVIILYKK